MDIPDYIWEWAQEMTGLKKPTTFLREQLGRAFVAYYHDPEGSSPAAPEALEDLVEQQWKALGLELVPVDSEFTEARKHFVAKLGGTDEAALKFFESPNFKHIYNPRAWLIDWWHKQQDRASFGHVDSISVK